MGPQFRVMKLLLTFLDELSGHLNPQERPAFVALIGSRATGINHPQSDIDLLVILNHNEGEIGCSPQKCQTLEREIKKFEESGKFAVICVPTFALLQHSVEMARRHQRGDLLTFHLLVYPTFQYLLAWENPGVVQGFLGELDKQNIIIGSDAQIPRAKGRKAFNFPDTYSNLFNVFQNSYVYFLHIRDLDVDFALQYGLKHLRYCIKHLAAAQLKAEHPTRASSKITWNQILRHSNELPGKGRELFLELDAIRPDPPRQPTKLCNPNTLHRLYKEGWKFFQDCHPKQPPRSELVRSRRK